MDDLVMFEADARLAVIDAHPNIHVRLFNPWRNRSLIGRALAGMAHF